jgi:hypothetical protein
MKISDPSEALVGLELDFNASTILDFWRWAYSILSNDPTKGEFAEWLVGKLLGLPTPPGGRIEGADWDFLTPEGVKLEIKAAAYWQAWKLRNRHDGSWRLPTEADFAKLTKIQFAGLHKRPAIDVGVTSAFKADLYIFCLQHEKDPAKWNGMDLTQWSFYMLPASILQTLKEVRDAAYKAGQLPKSFNLALPAVQKHAAAMTAFEFQNKAPKLIKALADQRAAQAIL